MINLHMIKLAQELGLPSQKMVEVNGVYRVPVDEGVVVEVRDQLPGFAFFCNLGTAPTTRQEALYQQLLLGNLFGQGTGGAVLALTEDGKQLTLSLEVGYSVPYPEFKMLLEDFFNHVDFWREEIANHTKAKPPALH